jgi:hypothetical protein
MGLAETVFTIRLLAWEELWAEPDRRTLRWLKKGVQRRGAVPWELHGE